MRICGVDALGQANVGPKTGKVATMWFMSLADALEWNACMHVGTSIVMDKVKVEN